MGRPSSSMLKRTRRGPSICSNSVSYGCHLCSGGARGRRTSSEPAVDRRGAGEGQPADVDAHARLVDSALRFGETPRAALMPQGATDVIEKGSGSPGTWHSRRSRRHDPQPSRRRPDGVEVVEPRKLGGMLIRFGRPEPRDRPDPRPRGRVPSRPPRHRRDRARLELPGRDLERDRPRRTWHRA